MRFLHWLLHRREEEHDLDEEVRFHLQQETQLRIERGEPPESAWRAARRDFGNVALAQEVARGMWGWGSVERAAQDFRYGVRTLRKNPGFTAVALAALALGIGATTAIFSVVNAVLLKPLPFSDPARLVMIWERSPAGKSTVSVQTQNFLDWRQRNRSFQDIAALFELPVNLEGAGDPVQRPGLLVTAGFFEILGIQPLLGRVIRPQDDQYQAPPVVVLAHGLWQRRYGGRPDIVGRSIIVNRKSCRVIGVMPADFRFPTHPQADLYLPLQINPADAPRDGRNYQAVARLKPRVTLAEAQADMQALAAQTARERPAMNARFGATVVPLMDQTVGDARALLWVLLGAVGFVLLIACANVSNLLLMRAAARRREIAVRVALGAGRWRLLHQLIVESVLLSVLGGALGFVLAFWGIPAVIRALPAGFPLPRLQEIAVNRGVLLFDLAVSLACGLFFGIFPLLQVDRGHLNQGLQAGGRSASAAGRKLRSLLVVSEIALAMLLVIGAGLMLRSFTLLSQVDPGFRPDHLVTFQMQLATQLDERWVERRANLSAQLLESVRAVPGVVSAGSIHLLPLTGMQSGSSYSRADRPAPPPGSAGGDDVSVVSDGYFRTMGIPILAGREFDLRDRLESPRVGILNQTAAQAIYPGENPVGKRLRVAWTGSPMVEVVGVASDIRHNGLDTRPDPCLFLPQSQAPSGYFALLVRTHAEPATLVPSVQAAILAVAPRQGTREIRTMESVLADSIARPRLQTTVMSLFGFLALALASVGIYAVVSYSTEQRTREMGIRLALGAEPASILHLVLSEGMLLAGIGIALGVAAALVLTRYLATLLFTIRPTDALVYAAVSTVLAAAAVSGCYFPARRAMRVDPAVVLREE